ATHLRVLMVHLAGESAGRQPARDGVCVEECAIDLLGWRGEYTVEFDCAWHDVTPEYEVDMKVFRTSWSWWTQEFRQFLFYSSNIRRYGPNTNMRLRL